MAKFVWKAPSQTDLTQTTRQMQEGGLFESIFKPGIRKYKQRRGENHVRILPPTFGKRNYPVLPIFVHFKVGPDEATFLCPFRMAHEDCAVCDTRKILLEDGDEEAASAIKPQMQYLAWVIDRNDRDDALGPQVMQYGYKVNSSIAAVSLEEEGGTLVFFDPYEGYDLTYIQNHKGGAATNVDYVGHKFSRNPSPVHRKEEVMNKWLEYIQDHPLDEILKDVDYEYVKKALTSRSKSSVADDHDEELPARTSRSLRDDLDDEIPERGAEDEKARRDTGYDPETGEVIEDKPWEDEKKEETRQRPRVEVRERPKLADAPEPRAAASSAVARLRERRRAAE